MAQGNDPLWVYYLFIVSVNVGSIANVVQYICHEGFGITENDNQTISEYLKNFKRKNSKKKFHDDIELGLFHNSDNSVNTNETLQISGNICSNFKDEILTQLEKVKCVDNNFFLRN